MCGAERTQISHLLIHNESDTSAENMFHKYLSANYELYKGIQDQPTVLNLTP
jgi:hypothetical protein